MNNHIIRHVRDKNLYWSNHFGWGSIDMATKFGDSERSFLNLPIDGYWERVEENPEIIMEKLQDIVEGSSQLLQAIFEEINTDCCTKINYSREDKEAIFKAAKHIDRLSDDLYSMVKEASCKSRK